MPIPKALSLGEETFAMQCKAHNLTPEREFIFAPPRKYRFDFAFLRQKIAVEVDGGTKMNGRHNRHGGFEKDAEKINLATKMGWAVLRYTTGMVERGDAINDVLEML